MGGGRGVKIGSKPFKYIPYNCSVVSTYLALATASPNLSHAHPGTPKTLLTSTYPLIPELRESVDNDTEHDVQSNGGDDDEE